jgi:short-subunit dehydrogenase
MKTILVTGGSSGIGYNLIQYLLSLATFKIIYTYNSNEIRIDNHLCSSYRVDFTDEIQINNFLEYLNTVQIDILVNNYHTGFHPVHSHKADKSDMLNGFIKNVIPTILITNFLLVKFKKAKTGKIVTVLSNSLLSNKSVGKTLYLAEKNYLLSFVKGWNLENQNFGIKSLAVFPKAISTNINRHLDPNFFSDFDETSFDEINHELMTAINI